MKNSTFIILASVLVVAIITTTGFLVWKKDTNVFQTSFMRLQLPRNFEGSVDNLSGDVMFGDKRLDSSGVITNGKISFQYTASRRGEFTLDGDGYEKMEKVFQGRKAIIENSQDEMGKLEVYFSDIRFGNIGLLGKNVHALDFDNIGLFFSTESLSKQDRKKILDIIETISFPDNVTL